MYVPECKAIELFANLCGQGIGAHKFFDIIISSDISADSEAVFKHLQRAGVLHPPASIFIREDIRNVSFMSMQWQLQRVGLDLRPGEVDFLFGGPPCFKMTFLNTVDRSIFHPMNLLMLDMVRVIGETKPKVFWIEQVPALLSDDMEPFWQVLSLALDGLGLYEWDVATLNAMHYGGFQSRDRVTIIGVRKDLGVAPSFPVGQSVDLDSQSAYAVIGAERFRSTQFKKRPQAPKDGREHVFGTLTSDNSIEVFRNKRWGKLTIQDRLKLAHMDGLDLSILSATKVRKMLGMMVLPPFAKAISAHVVTLLRNSEATYNKVGRNDNHSYVAAA